jgi:tungstate transport system substrate-binding protein
LSDANCFGDEHMIEGTAMGAIKQLISATAAFAFAVLLTTSASAADEHITVASTTSTEQSGLFAHILPIFQEATGIQVRVIAQGTGQALETGRRGDVDVVFVHAEPAEIQFIEDGHGVERFPVMYNEFIIVGPAGDPAGVAGGSDAVAAFTAIAGTQSLFISRGDDSGTHQAERALWAEAGIEPAGAWYREVGSGMGPTLNTAAEMPAYTFADRGTWISFENRRELEILVEGDERLFNQYGVILVNPERHPHVKAEAGQAFIDWLISPEGQRAIGSYQLRGEQLFFPNATEERS